MPSIDNRWRWDNGYAFQDWHIFRDRYERSMPRNYQPNHHRMRASDWPEVGDFGILIQQRVAQQGGQPVDEEALANAEENLKKTTPTSLRWRGPQPDKDKEHSNVHWKPPYFQEPGEQWIVLSCYENQTITVPPPPMTDIYTKQKTVQ